MKVDCIARGGVEVGLIFVGLSEVRGLCDDDQALGIEGSTFIQFCPGRSIATLSGIYSHVKCPPVR